jgi:hypothetical protein
MKTKIVIGSTILLMGAVAVHAQTMSATQNTTSNSSWFDSSQDLLYRANELSLEAFGAGASDGHRHDYYYDDHRRDGKFGGGGGLEYFFCRYIGVEADGFALANRDHTQENAGGNLALRYPIGQTGFSPYIFGGGGAQWNHGSEGYETGGAGLEFRFTRSIGLFGDGSFVGPANTRNYGMGRIGVRFSF